MLVSSLSTSCFTIDTGEIYVGGQICFVIIPFHIVMEAIQRNYLSQKVSFTFEIIFQLWIPIPSNKIDFILWYIYSTKIISIVCKLKIGTFSLQGIYSINYDWSTELH